MAIVSLVSIVFTLEVKNGFYKLRLGVVYELMLVRNVFYKYKDAAKNCGLNTEL